MTSPEPADFTCRWCSESWPPDEVIVAGPKIVRHLREHHPDEPSAVSLAWRITTRMLRLRASLP